VPRALEVDIVVTVDRSMMSNHRGREFLGFMTTAPPVGLPERLWNWMAMPKIAVDGYGRPLQAPYGLRKIEAALQDGGIAAAIIDPDHIEKYIKNGAKAVFIGHHDYFAFNPPSSEYWLVTGEEPINRRSFMKFMARLLDYKRRYNPDLKIVVGGPAAWQWLYVPEYLRRFEVDTIVEGEGESVAVELARMILEGRKLPRLVVVGPRDVPGLSEIPTIKAPSINGLVEIMRGCPRRCSFCSVTLRALRYYTLEMIEAELKVNAESGTREGILHSDDVPLYGAKGLEPNMEALVKLHMLAKKYYHEVSWSHASLATVLYGETRYRMISRLAEILLDGRQKYVGLQTGIETGSPRLAERVMPGKVAPYKPEMWPEVVREAFQIMHDNKFIPAATVILGLPGETADDVVRTIELIEDLKSYRSLIVPMFFVPMGALRRGDWFTSVHLTREHAELMLVTLRHSLKWVKDIIKNYYATGAKMAPLRVLLLRFVKMIENFASTLTPDRVLYYIERSRKKLIERSGDRGPIVEKIKRKMRAPVEVRL